MKTMDAPSTQHQHPSIRLETSGDGLVAVYGEHQDAFISADFVEGSEEAENELFSCIAQLA